MISVKRVQKFDAFPKVNSQNSVRSQRGGLSSLLTYTFGLLFIWIEIGGFLGGYIDRQFSVDDVIKPGLSINVDMIVAMPCQYLHTTVEDITLDRYLAGETLNFEGIQQFFIPPNFNINNVNDAHDSPELEQIMQESLRAEFRIEGQVSNDQAPACHIFGSIPINQVKGDFRITAKGYGYRDRITTPQDAINFTHVIQEFSFGEFYPFINNPLDATGKVTEQKFFKYMYSTKVVPTSYQKLNLVVDTNQYSVTENHHELPWNDQMKLPIGVPGIYIKYDFEPIKMVIAERRLPFIQFVAKLATIAGGILITAGYLFRLYEKLLGLIFGKKFVDKDREKKEGGLLDSEVKYQD
ncbi:ER-derived vesicles protein ERV41 [Spathaspora sp. JA1]|nr:ER-derived vesicles protein ERV41 [Spathaspora sp. JA1]